MTERSLAISASSTDLEIGIVLLLPDDVQEISEHLSEQVKAKLQKKGLNYSDISNIPHVSLFQLCIERGKFEALVNNLRFALKEVHLPMLILKQNLTDTQENIFWDVRTYMPQESLDQVHRKVVDIACQYRSSQLMKQVRDAFSSLTDSQKNKVKTYGIFWGLPGSWNPHVTIVYNSGVDRLNSAGNRISLKDLIQEIFVPKNLSFSVQKIAIARLGDAGNVEEILAIIKE